MDAAAPKKPLFYVVDWLPPNFGAVGQYALITSQKMAADGHEVHLIGLTRDAGGEQISSAPGTAGVLTVKSLSAKPYEKTRLLRRLLWTLGANIRLSFAVLRHPRSRNATIQFTGAPPFMLYFAVALKHLRGAQLIYRITDFYPEAIIAHMGRRPLAFGLLEQLTWWLRRRVDSFEVLGEDQRELLLRGGIPPERITVKRDTTPVPITGRETPAPKPAALEGRKVLLYSGNYGVAHELETVALGLAHHHQMGADRFGLWLNASGNNADILERRLRDIGAPVARTPPVTLDDFAALLAAADAHLIALRPEFSGIVFPSKVYACILSNRPIVFVGPQSSDAHLLCSRAPQRYVHVMPGDFAGFSRALDELSASP